MREFGSLTMIQSETITYDGGGNATVTFRTSQNQEILVLGMTAGGVAGAKAQQVIVTSLLYKGREHILGYRTGITSIVPNGVPFRHMGSLAGNNQFRRWKGLASELRELLKLVAKLEGDAWGQNPDQLFNRAWQSLKWLACGADPDFAGFIVDGDDLTMDVTDATDAGTDQPVSFTLIGLALGERVHIGSGCREHNEPWWFAHTPQAFTSTANAAVRFTRRFNFPIQCIGRNGELIHIESMASLFATADGTTVADELQKLQLGTVNEDAGESPFFGDRAPLSAFADGGTLAMFNRQIWDKKTLGWQGNQDAMLVSTTMSITDYILSLSENGYKFCDTRVFG